MRNYDFIIEKLEKAYETTQSKVGTWQKEVLLVILEALLGIYEDLRLQEEEKYIEE